MWENRNFSHKQVLNTRNKQGAIINISTIYQNYIFDINYG